MRDLVDTTEMYLRTIYELEEEGVTPLRARIAERLDQSGPTVSQTVARMERDGLVKVASDRSLQMTPEGRKLATAVMRKHRLAERLLTDIIGLDTNKVHDEACRWEHVMSDEVERRLVGVLEHFDSSPFGNPIPALEELGVEGHKAPAPAARAVDVATPEEQQVTVVQINEILQVDVDAMQSLLNADIHIGDTVALWLDQGHVMLRKGESEVELLDDLAHAIRVEI